MKTIGIILPAYNEASVLAQVLKRLNAEIQPLRDCYQVDIIVVDDGSQDRTSDIGKDNHAIVIRHMMNRGVGAALATGFAYAKRRNYAYTFMMDSDGQHNPHDLHILVSLLEQDKADVVIGSRLLNRAKMPLDRQILNRLSSVVTWLLFGVWVTDSQSGFRGFSNKALQAIRIKTQGMESCSEMFDDIFKYKLRVQEVPIDVIYTSYSRSKGQTNWNSINIVTKLLLRLFRE